LLAKCTAFSYSFILYLSLFYLYSMIFSKEINIRGIRSFLDLNLLRNLVWRKKFIFWKKNFAKKFLDFLSFPWILANPIGSGPGKAWCPQCKNLKSDFQKKWFCKKTLSFGFTPISLCGRPFPWQESTGGAQSKLFPNWNRRKKCQLFFFSPVFFGKIFSVEPPSTDLEKSPTFIFFQKLKKTFSFRDFLLLFLRKKHKNCSLRVEKL